MDLTEAKRIQIGDVVAYQGQTFMVMRILRRGDLDGPYPYFTLSSIGTVSHADCQTNHIHDVPPEDAFSDMGE